MSSHPTRELVTQKILYQKVALRLNWKNLASKLRCSVEWTVAACLGQMQMTSEQAAVVALYFNLDKEERMLLETVPHRNAIQSGSVPSSDPLLYRLYEMIGVFGPAMKEIIQDEFGDGIMSAIDFNFHIEREKNTAGDRVKITLSGKFLPYKNF